MKRTPRKNEAEVCLETTEVQKNAGVKISSPARRSFLGKLGAGAAATAAVSVIGSAPAAVAQVSSTAAPSISSNARVQKAKNLRINLANKDAAIPVPDHSTAGDEGRYSDKSASYSKGLLQDKIGLVNPAAWKSFKKALASGSMADWEAIIIGGTRTQNGPQGAYAYDLECLDSVQFGNAPFHGDPTGLPVVPPFDQVTSPEYGTQLIEQYWASMLRDVAFTDYSTNATAIAAAAELGAQQTYRGPRDSSGNVTPDLLFRGAFPGDTIGPYMSQLMITPTSFGQQPIDQLMTTYAAGIDFMTDPTTFFQVQNGQSTGLSTTNDPTRRYLHDGRGLAAWTHNDVLYQGYFIALLVLGTLKAPVNPGNPYVGSKTQNGFCTFGGPDFAASMGECAAKALQKVWWQKWLLHLTPRPEAGGGLVNQVLIGNPDKIQAIPNSNVLNSQAVQQSFAKNNSYFLSQAFPEGSPTHPSYPTGHGTVAGACITFLKFFFDENVGYSKSVGALERRYFAPALHRSGCGPDHRRWRTEQAGPQRQLRSRYPRRHSLADRYRVVDHSRRGHGDQHASGSCANLQREVLGHLHQGGRKQGHHHQSVRAFASKTSRAA